MIHWEGTNTERNCHWKALSRTFMGLYDGLIKIGLIGSTDYNLYDSTVLAKFGKTENDPEFLDEDGEVIYEKVQEFVEKHNLTDKEIWEMIGSDNGNAYKLFFNSCIVERFLRNNKRRFSSYEINQTKAASGLYQIQRKQDYGESADLSASLIFNRDRNDPYSL